MLTKERLLDYVNRTTSVAMDRSTFTIGFARRAATYKRADLLFEDMERLKRIHSEVGPIQLLFAGKAHPHDQQAKDLIRRVFHAKTALQQTIRMAYLDNYDMYVGGLLTAGVDLWLNNPEPPLEASGTSGMKAAMNGVPSLSVLDGWWVEGWVEGVTGWAIGRDDHKPGIAADRHRAAAFLYDKLEYVVLPLFYHERDRYIDVMRHAVALNGSYFSTHRMVQQYVIRAYLH
jgi:starch phosphorylase